MTEEELAEYWEKGGNGEDYWFSAEIQKADVWRIVETYQKELSQASYTEIMESMGRLSFSYLFEKAEEYEYSYSGSEEYPIPHTFEETLSLLKETGKIVRD